jgi:hypothetical protein
MSQGEQKKPMSTGRAIFTIAMTIFWIGMAAYFAHYLYVTMVVEPAELENEDARYKAHGCYISSNGEEYICPNGLPPR